MPNMFVEGDSSVGDRILYRQNVTRNTNQPYIVRHRLRYENQVITSISVLPLNVELHCPEVEVVEGGINCRDVELRLKTSSNVFWGCKVVICGTSETKH